MSEETAVVLQEAADQPDAAKALEVAPEVTGFGYAGAGSLRLGDAQRKAFAEPFADDAHDVLPTGEVYVSQVHYRRKLNEVFGPGGWALVPRAGYVKQGETLIREYALVVDGRFVSEATGEADYHETNKRMSYASTAEAVKSNALTRCCKDLSIGSECWDKRFCERFKRANCVKVWRKKERAPQWRRKDAEPWFDEKGSADERPAPPAASTTKPAHPSSKAGCPFCGSADFVLSADGASAVCSQEECGKGWNLGRQG